MEVIIVIEENICRYPYDGVVSQVEYYLNLYKNLPYNLQFLFYSITMIKLSFSCLEKKIILTESEYFGYR